MHRGVRNDKQQEMTMNRKLAFAALSLAIVMGSVFAAAAAEKKHGALADPREAYWAKHKGGSNPTWCDSDPSCNGWGEWLGAVSAGKMKY
jgi:hypothetical protein